MMDTEHLCKTYDHLKGDRGTWESHWEEIAQVVLPRMRGFQGQFTKGEKRTEKIFDAKPCLALERFASVMDSMLTPRQQIWHKLKTTDEALNDAFRVKEWFYQVNHILYSMRYAPKANFSGQNSERWISVGAFGTGSMYIDYKDGLRYRTLNLKNTYFLENHQGIIDTVFRRIMYTARQAIQEWGEDMMPEEIIKSLENPAQSSREWEFVHIVMPRADVQMHRADAKGKPWASYYISVKHRQMVAKEGGYHTFPYNVSRYVTAPDEVYGRSPAMMVLPDIKMLNQMSKTDIRAVHKLVDPPILLNNDGVLGGRMKVDIRPNGLIPGGVNKDGRQMIQPFQTGARVDIADTKMDQRRQSIDDAFLVTLFQILVETPRMTATEALIRAQEKGMLLAPTMGRQQSETLGPEIERELDLLMRAHKLPPIPPELIEAGGEYEIIYDSPLSRMQRAEELVGVQRTLEILTPFANIKPDILDIFDEDQLARVTADVSGVPTKVLRSPEDIAQKRANDQQQQALATAAQVAQPVASALKDTAQAQSLLTQQR